MSDNMINGLKLKWTQQILNRCLHWNSNETLKDLWYTVIDGFLPITVSSSIVRPNIGTDGYNRSASWQKCVKSVMVIAVKSIIVLFSAAKAM